MTASRRDRMVGFVALAALAFLSTSRAWAAPAKPAAGSQTEDLSRWALVAPVRLGAQAPQAAGLVEFALNPDAISQARADLGDLRLFDGAGQIVPYVIRVDSGQKGKPTAYEPVRTYNPVYVSGKQSSVTVDFGKAATRTEIEVLTPGRNFRRRVMVEASSDGQSWQILRKSDWLFNVSHENGQYAKSRVALPDNDFRYLRVTVFHAPDDPAELPIEKVRARYVKNIPPVTAAVPVKADSVTVTDAPRFKATEIDADLGFEKLPLCELTLAFEDELFMRRVEVLGRDSKTLTITQLVENAPPRKRQIDAPWRSLGGGVIHRFDKLTTSRLNGVTASNGDSAGGRDLSANLSLPLTGGCRYLKIRIYNGDDAPLKFVKTGLSVRRLQQYVGFQSKGVGPYKLYLGNDRAPAPQYDLSHFADRLRAEGVTKAEFQAVAPNPVFESPDKEPSWSERHKGLIWFAMIFLGLVLTVMVIRQLKKVPSGGREH